MGYAGYFKYGQTAFLYAYGSYGIFVENSFQRKGIGPFLLKMIIEKAKDNGCNKFEIRDIIYGKAPFYKKVLQSLKKEGIIKYKWTEHKKKDEIDKIQNSKEVFECIKLIVTKPGYEITI